MPDEIFPWQREAWTRLQARFRERKLPHALLITGSVGMGKVQFAASWARALLCVQPQADGLACGACRACLLLVAGSHPDWRQVSPPEEGKVIGVDQIRDLLQWVALTPQYGAHKIVVIESPDKMNINSANSLLKTLEEPPPHSLLILVTARPSKLPLTIISRCQRIHFPSPSLAEASAWLIEQRPEIVNSTLLLKLADGSPLQALKLAADGVLNNRQVLLELIEKLTQGRLEPVAAADAALKIGVHDTLHCLYSWTCDMIRLAASGPEASVVNEDMKERLQVLANGATSKSLFARLEQTTQALRLADRQLNPQLLLEDTLMAWRNTAQRLY